MKARPFYWLYVWFGRFVFFQTQRKTVIVRPQIAERDGGYILACSHIGHLDPACMSVLMRRKVDWMARIEFYSNWFGAMFLRWADAFSVNRRGVPVSSIRTAIRRVREGRIVGIFPEGGVASADESACCGGEIKAGACMVAQRTGAPIVPAVIVGTHVLNHVWPWIPWRRGRLWVAYGKPVYADAQKCGRRDRRAARRAMAEEVQNAFAALYAELCDTAGVEERFRPFETSYEKARGGDDGGALKQTAPAKSDLVRRGRATVPVE